MVVEKIDCRMPGVAEKIFEIRQLAYTQEAQLLGVADFPPLNVSVDQLRVVLGQSFEIRKGGCIIGVVQIEYESKAMCFCISSLVVSPDYQRQGFGAALLATACALTAGEPLEALNKPALLLYKQHGFIVIKDWQTLEGIHLVRLRHFANELNGKQVAA